MKWTRVCLVLAGCLVVLPAGAQIDARGLQDLIKGKPLVLRNYSAEPVAKYAWVDGKLVDTPPGVRTLGVFTVGSVKLHGQKISISGSRATLIRDTKKNKTWLSVGSAMEIQIDLAGADLASVLPQLRDSLFFPDVQSAMADLPEVGKRLAGAAFAGETADPCKCVRYLADDGWKEVAVGDGKFVAPKMLKNEAPDIPIRPNGTVKFGFLVKANGELSDFWLLTSSGDVLDRPVETAVRRYRFSPALYDKQPVGIVLAIELHFQTQ